MQWLSRTIAVLIFMVGPGVLGRLADRYWGTSFFMPAGFLLGIVLATLALLVLAQKLAPVARGKPLADEPEARAESAERDNPRGATRSDAPDSDTDTESPPERRL